MVELTLMEAGRGKPDDIGIAANFAELDLNPILASDGTKEPAKRRTASNNDYSAMSLRVETKRDANFDVQVKTKKLIFRAMQFADFRASGHLSSGEVAVRELTFAFAGGTLDASGSTHSAASGNQVVVNAAVSGADASRLAGMLGAGANQIAGKINGRAALEMAGETVKDALK